MNALRLTAIVMIVAGLLGASYGGFSYTKQTHEANIGPLHLQVVEQERVNIPLWAGLGLAAVGLVLLLALGVFLLWAAINYTMLTSSNAIPDPMREIVIRMLGSLDAATMLILSYYFGNSHKH